MKNKKLIEKRKGKKKMVGWIIALCIIAALGTGAAIGWSALKKEHTEAQNVSLADVNFSKLKDGTYRGYYEGGMYKWRKNEVEITVSSGKVTKIRLLDPSGPAAENAQQKNKYSDPDQLYERVIQSQSLQVDAISGATLTSKAWLKAVESALLTAQNK